MGGGRIAVFFFYVVIRESGFFLGNQPHANQYSSTLARGPISEVCAAAAALRKEHPGLAVAHADRPLSVYIGASPCKRPAGYISFEQRDLDVTVRSDFSRLFCEASVDTFLTEHTFEHITYEGGQAAFENFAQFLKPGGMLRIAVPNDGTRAGQQIGEKLVDTNYGHVAAYGFEFLKDKLLRAGFSRVELIEEKVKYNATAVMIRTRGWDRCQGKTAMSGAR